ncbi:AAA family ATPase [Kitasatospora sp. NPDC101801]|uniref:AAA family ATPase n=1 Tax=Kitasatospora sp. NPDC101801 TaxID=3364103 RepID=UPI00382EB601
MTTEPDRDALVGRRGELQLLEQALRLTRSTGADGRARIVSVGGEPWIGKTRLLAELAALAGAEGWRVAVGRAGRTGPGTPFELVVDALDDRLGSGEVELPTPLALRLGRVFPALGGAGAAVAPGDEYWLIRAVRSALELLADGPGLLLVLDDAHRADPLTLELLDHLVRHPPRGRLLTVLAHRDSPAANRLAVLRGTGGGQPWQHLELGPLAAHEAGALLGPELDPVDRQLLLRDAAGVPGLLRACAATGPGREPVGSFELATAPPAPGGGPVALDFGPLSGPAWRTAWAAATLGGAVTPQPVAEVAGLPLSQVLLSIDELQAEALLRPEPDGSGFRFRHPVVRTLLLRGSRAGWQYGAAGRALSALRRTGAPAGLLAAQLERAPSLGPADRQLLLAGATADLHRAPAAAVRRLRRWAAGPGAPAEQAEQALGLGQALTLAGRGEEALTVYARARATGGGRAPAGGPAAEAESSALRGLGRWAAARELLAAAEDVELAWAALALEVGDPVGGRTAAQWAEHGYVRAVRSGDPAAQAHALALLAAAHAVDERFAEAAEVAGAAAEQLAGQELPLHRLESVRWLTDAEFYLGRRHRAEALLGRTFEAVLDTGQWQLLGRTALGLSRARWEAGDLAGAADRAVLAVAAGRRFDSPPLAVDALLWHSRIRLAGRDLPGAYRAATAAGRAAAGLGRLWQRRVAETLRVLGAVPAPTAAVPAGRPGGAGPTGLTDAQLADAGLADAGPTDLVRAAPGPGPTQVQTPEPGPGLAELSRREVQVAGLVSEGCTNQQIAGRMGVSAKTVETYLSRIFRKLGIVSRAQVAHLVGLDDRLRRGPGTDGPGPDGSGAHGAGPGGPAPRIGGNPWSGP